MSSTFCFAEWFLVHIYSESESGMGDEVELVCPYCFEEPFNFSSLGDHIHEEHSGQQRASVVSYLQVIGRLPL